MINKSHIKYFATYMIFVIIMMVMLYLAPQIGLADNNDFNRTISAFSLSAKNNIKHLSFESEYVIKEPQSLVAYFLNIFKPVKDTPTNYYSTQFIFVKLALFINSLYNFLFNLNRTQFHIAFLSIIYIFIYAVPLTLLFQKKIIKNKYVDWLFKALCIVVLMDSAYLVYFNSFFGEATTMIFLVFSVVLLITIQWDKPKIWKIVLLMISILIFSGSKSANFPTALLLLIPTFYLILHTDLWKKKVILIICFIFTIIMSYSYLQRVPEWMDKVTTYQATFFGVFKDQPDIEGTIKELHLPEDFYELECTHGYMTDKKYDIYGEKFEKLFFDRVSKFDIFLYYLKHPIYFYGKLDKSAEAALPIRPTYLSNYETQEGEYNLIFENRFSLWEKFRKQFSGRALIFFSLLIILFAISSVIKYKRHKGFYVFLIRGILLLSTLGQFIVPIISNGEADLLKHMFLFNVHFDIIFLWVIYDGLNSSARKIISIHSIGIVVLLSLLFVHVSQPEIITLGTYNGKPIEWIVLESKDGIMKIIAKDIIFEASYDQETNDWRKSELREQLNESFLNAFTKDEIDRIYSFSYPLALSYNNLEDTQKGDRPHYWFSSTKYAMQNYERAYQTTVVDKVTLPSVADIDKLMKLKPNAVNEDKGYWLRTPYYSSTYLTRMVDKDGFIYHRNSKQQLGVRPLLYITEN